MQLTQYIDSLGVKKISEIYAVSVSTVSQWRNLESAPTPTMAGEIVEKTQGLVTWEGIYKPVALRRTQDENQLEMNLE